MDLGLEALTRASAAGRDLYRPEFFRLALPADRERLRELLKRNNTLAVHDDLLSQLAELVRALNPSIKYTKPELAEAANAHLGGVRAEDYGVWVHYPWSNRLVHLLDEVEFALVRTDRNRNKITREEQATLSTKKIGVIGLSVGQSISLTLALERSFGELRIADFDTLDLSNLNRIRSGVHSLGQLKTVNVAREIAELDPFLKVTLYNEGLTRDNIDGFLNDGGKLDILVDECDSVDVKILCRQRSKAYRIPVIMDTSDRGMLDVERFDLEPERPILHGLIDHLDPAEAAKAKTNEEKLPFVLPIAGIDTLSKRMKASMLEIESSVTTWPQLASSVVLGGALGADHCRKIALGQSRSSGRWYVDLDTITGELAADRNNMVPVTGPRPAPLTIEQMNVTAEAIPPLDPQQYFTEQEALVLAEAGALAPSAGNNQPWRFLLAHGRLMVFHDRFRSFSQLDRDGLISAISLGACLENMKLKAEACGLAVECHQLPSDKHPELVAMFTLRARGTAVDNGFAASIGLRCTNRRKPNGKPISEEALARLSVAVEGTEGCRAHIVQGTAQLTKVAELVCAAERLRMLNPIGHRELFEHEIRWSSEEAERTRDGLDLATMEMKPSEHVAMRVASDPAAIRLLREWNAGNGFKKMSGEAIRNSSAVCLISLPEYTPSAWLNGGRTAERMWLAATALGIAVHPISAPIFLAHHVRFDPANIFNRHESALILDALAGLRGLFNTEQREPLFMARLAYADAPSARSLRLPLEELFHVHQTVEA